MTYIFVIWITYRMIRYSRLWTRKQLSTCNSIITTYTEVIFSNWIIFSIVIDVICKYLKISLVCISSGSIRFAPKKMHTWIGMPWIHLKECLLCSKLLPDALL